jgi:hypothetical protein
MGDSTLASLRCSFLSLDWLLLQPVGMLLEERAVIMIFGLEL